VIVNKKLNELILMLFPIMAFVVTAILYAKIPDMIPSGYNLEGLATGLSEKSFIVFLIPIVSLFIYFYFMIIPKIDIERVSYKKSSITYNRLRYLMAIGITIINVVYLINLFNIDNPIVFVALKATFAVILFLIGDRLPKIKRNFFIGVVNAWTVSDNIVWMRTHRFTGFLACTISLILFILAFINTIWSTALYCSLIFVLVVVPHIYALEHYHKVAQKIMED